jgi:hypothetical protein
MLDGLLAMTSQLNFAESAAFGISINCPAYIIEIYDMNINIEDDRPAPCIGRFQAGQRVS